MDGFVDVTVDATGVITRVPADWVGDPVLGNGITLVVPEPEPTEPEEVGEPPTERNTAAEIEAFAEKAGIDLGGASTKAQKVAVIDAAIAAMPEAPPPASGNPDVQLVAGDESDVSPYPVVAAAQAAAKADTDTDDTGSSDETPATGEEEN